MEMKLWRSDMVCGADRPLAETAVEKTKKKKKKESFHAIAIYLSDLSAIGVQFNGREAKRKENKLKSESK